MHDEKPEFFEPKDILNVLDAEPVIFEQQLQLWEWIASYYMCSEGEVMAAALPAHFKLSSETILIFNEEYGDDFSALDHDEYMVGEALLIKKELKLDRSTTGIGFFACISGYQPADCKKSLLCMGSIEANICS